ncbi:lipoyl(octanoyl) transferase LipB [Gleimia hominis]|uniref:Octanoyltransferase n=1 Tax=Gleimia hominis TaxID=595468 RepID=A0ABU3IF33_9ACTO|nr:lipoyl(octanoyl) transferase LipB [Gleimia hominis]MDT3768082.1 lipoyl(octanoyl) transferase LipB [Gleimia hominis]
MQELNLLDRGPIPYMEGDRIQREVFEQVAAGERDHTLIVAQFEATYTAGRQTKPEDILNSDLPVVRIDRGGSVTWHGPGQLVIYPIVKLAPPADRIKYIRAVEAAVIEAAQDTWNIPATTIEGKAGAWLRDPDRKICAIGLKVARDTTMHGVAFNIDPDFSNAFTGIIPCGLVGMGVTSLKAEGVSATVDEVRVALVKKLREKLDPLLETIRLETISEGAH